MMHLCTFYTKQMVEKHPTIGREEVTLCSECAIVCQPDYSLPTQKRSICVRCGIKNFTLGKEA